MSKFWLYFAIGFFGNIVFQSLGLSALAATFCSTVVGMAIYTWREHA